MMHYAKTFEEHKANKADLELREKALISGKQALSVAVENLFKERQEFEESKNQHRKDADGMMAVINDNLAVSKEKLKNAKDKLSDLKAREERLSDNERIASDVLKKIYDANKILDIAKDKEFKVEERNTQLNEQQVKVMADVRKNNQRAAELEQLSNQIKVRENNVKLAEASLAKG